jgi:chromatin segregation and condensation protein Rec8/ScpA/Scc1 (kleisin family)
VSDQIEFLRGLLAGSERLHLTEVLATLTSRMEMVVTLIATLELARMGELAIDQSSLYGEIWLQRRTPANPLPGGVGS